MCSLFDYAWENIVLLWYNTLRYPPTAPSQNQVFIVENIENPYNTPTRTKSSLPGVPSGPYNTIESAPCPPPVLIPLATYTWPGPSIGSKLRIVAISDTHDRHRFVKVPPGDVLVHCGDIVFSGRNYTEKTLIKKYKDFNAWLAEQPHRVKLVIAGNHDGYLARVGKDNAKRLLSACTYLQDEEVRVDGWASFFGTPSSVGTSKNSAFQGKTLPLDRIPSTTDVLLIHQTVPNTDLERYLRSSSVRVVISGHLHCEYGIHRLPGIRATVVTASTLDGKYRPLNPPIAFDLKRVN